MWEIISYWLLAIVTTYCVLVTKGTFLKTLWTVSTTCWWLLAISETVTKIMNV